MLPCRCLVMTPLMSGQMPREGVELVGRNHIHENVEIEVARPGGIMSSFDSVALTGIRVGGFHGPLLISGGHSGFSRRRPLPISTVPMPARARLPMKLAEMEMPSSSRPPRMASIRIDDWIAATFRLPAASGASSAFWDIHVIQI